MEHALTCFRPGELGSGFFYGFCDQQRLLLVERKVMNALMRRQRKYHDFGLGLWPARGESGHKIRCGRSSSVKKPI